MEGNCPNIGAVCPLIVGEMWDPALDCSRTGFRYLDSEGSGFREAERLARIKEPLNK